VWDDAENAAVNNIISVFFFLTNGEFSDGEKEERSNQQSKKKFQFFLSFFLICVMVGSALRNFLNYFIHFIHFLCALLEKEKERVREN
jgi:hypothetical protein